MRQWALNRPIQYPNVPKEGYQGGLESRKFKASLSGRTVEVIVKVTDINLVNLLREHSMPAFSLNNIG